MLKILLRSILISISLKIQFDHDKSYSDAATEIYRCKVFTQNLNLIEKHNKLFAQGKYSYSLGINEHADMTKSEFISTHTGFIAPVDDDEEIVDVEVEVETTTTTQKPKSDEHCHKRQKRAASNWTVPDDWQPTKKDLRVDSLPV